VAAGRVFDVALQTQRRGEAAAYVLNRPQTGGRQSRIDERARKASGRTASGSRQRRRRRAGPAPLPCNASAAQVRSQHRVWRLWSSRHCVPLAHCAVEPYGKPIGKSALQSHIRVLQPLSQSAFVSHCTMHAPTPSHALEQHGAVRSPRQAAKASPLRVSYEVSSLRHAVSMPAHWSSAHAPRSAPHLLASPSMGAAVRLSTFPSWSANRAISCRRPLASDYRVRRRRRHDVMPAGRFAGVGAISLGAVGAHRSLDSYTASKTPPRRREKASLPRDDAHHHALVRRGARAFNGQPEGVKIAVIASTAWGQRTTLRRSRRMMQAIGCRRTRRCIGWRASGRRSTLKRSLAALRVALGGARSPRLWQLRAVRRVALRIGPTDLQATHHSGEAASRRSARGAAPPGPRARGRRLELVRRTRAHAGGATRD
jgi:hypothetical protein